MADRRRIAYSVTITFAVYTCGGQNGSIPVKNSQGDGFYEKNSCMVIEMEGVIDGERKVAPSLLVKGANNRVTF
jgi:hypothetical protein